MVKCGKCGTDYKVLCHVCYPDSPADDEEIKRAINASKSMIARVDAQLNEAIKNENWERAGKMDNYKNGMEQILIVFELACGG